MNRQCSHQTSSSKRDDVWLQKSATRRRFIHLWLLLSLIGLQACALLPQPEIFEPTDPLPAGLATQPAPDVYLIDQAELTLHTFRGGWLSQLAHDHVMKTTQIGGSVTLAEPIYESSALLYFRPWDLILDRPADRASAAAAARDGAFASTRSETDIAATRSRMLGPRGFDSNRYPFVVVEVSWVNETRVGLSIQFRDSVVDTEVAVSWTRKPDELEAQADFELNHRFLGISPYSAFGGAIAVAESIRVQLRLSASRTTAAGPASPAIPTGSQPAAGQ